MTKKEKFVAKRLAQGLPVFINADGGRYAIKPRKGALVVTLDGKLVNPSASFAEVLVLLDKGVL